MKRRANGEGSEPYRYRTGQSAWAAAVSVRMADGRRKRAYVYGSTKQEVRRKRDAKLAEQRRGVTRTVRTPTLAEYGREWIDGTLATAVATGSLASTTRASYRDNWKRHVEPDLGHLRLEELTPTLLRAWLLRKATEPSSRGRVLSVRSQMIIFGVLRRALNDAVRDELIAQNPLSRVRGPRGSSPPVEPMTAEEAKALIEATRGTELWSLWVLLLGTGMRIGEALALRWSDLDLDRRVLRVSRTVARLRGDFDPDLGHHRTSLIVKEPKTAASAAVVAVPDFVVAALRDLRRSQSARRLAASHWQDNDLVFSTSIGTLLEHRNVRREFIEGCTRAGITRRVRLHDTRHTAAAFLVAAKVDIRVIQSVLRHSRLATTADVYAHVMDEVKHDAAAAMDRTLRELGGPAGQI